MISLPIDKAEQAALSYELIAIRAQYPRFIEMLKVSLQDTLAVIFAADGSALLKATGAARDLTEILGLIDIPPCERPEIATGAEARGKEIS